MRWNRIFDPKAGTEIDSDAAPSAPTRIASRAAVASATSVAAPTTPSASATATTTGAVSATSPVPTWISALKDAALKADLSADAASGTITKAQLGAALADLAGELSSRGLTLSASQLADLKAIAANIASMGSSAYLQFITKALVNGNAANAWWTGGAATSVALGNLATGSSATKLQELIGKWFSGTDLPASAVSMDGHPDFTISYSRVSAPLFGASGPSLSDVNQGYLGDCYLLAPLAEAASQDPAAITSMITDNGDGTYGVRFYVNGAARYVTVNTQLADGGWEFNHGANLWASLIEQAYAEAQAQGLITGNPPYADGNSFSSIGNGGSPEFALEEITDASAITDFNADSSNSGWDRAVYNRSLSGGVIASNLTTSAVLSTLDADLLVGDDLVLTSLTYAWDSSGALTLIADHAMSITGYDAATGLLQIRNPWGGSNSYWDTTFEISLSTLLADGDTITVDNVGTASSVAAAPVVAASALQSMAQVKTFSVSDAVANVDGGLAGLKADGKLTSVTVTGTSGADALVLTGLKAATTIAMGGDSDAAALTNFTQKSAGVGAASGISLGSGYDSIALGSGSDTIAFSLGAASGVESVTAFNSAYDILSVTLNGASLEQTLVGGGDWISSSTDLTHGVYLAGVKSVQKAAISNGVATIA